VLVGPPGLREDDAGAPRAAERAGDDQHEALDVTDVNSIAGLLGPHPHVVATRPLSAPHHAGQRRRVWSAVRVAAARREPRSRHTACFT
jgi:hypothetical protein